MCVCMTLSSYQISLLLGDYMSATPRECGEFDFVWDRGGISSVAPSRFGEYLTVTTALLRPGGQALLEFPVLAGVPK